MVLLSGTTVSFGEALSRAALFTVYIAAMLATVGAIGLFFSTLTEVPMGAMAATATLTVIAQIVDTIPQVQVIHEYLYTHWWLAVGDLMRDPMAFDDVSTGLLTQAVYLAVFGTSPGRASPPRTSRPDQARRSRISLTRSMVVCGCRNANRPMVSPSQADGGMKATWSASSWSAHAM